MKKNFRSNLLLLLAFCAIAAAKDYIPTGPDMCKDLGSEDPTIETILPDGTVHAPITQTTCSKFFKIELKNPATPLPPSTKFIQFEIEITDDNTEYLYDPILAERNNSKPMIRNEMIDGDRQRYLDIDNWDGNAYYLGKKYHIITVELDKKMDDLYFGFYKYHEFDADFTKINQDITYTVKATASTLYPCQKDCNGNGDCSQEKQKCICGVGFFDLDCSVEATGITLKKLVTQEVQPQSWGYLALNITNYDNDLSVGVKTSGPANMSIKYNLPGNFSIPNLKQNTGRINFDKDLTKDIILYEGNLKYYKKGTLVIGMYNNQTESITVDMTITVSDSDDGLRKAIMYAMIGIAAVLIVLWGVFSYLRYKIYREAEAMQRALQQQMAHRVALTKEELDQYFPKKNFENLTSSFPQTLCSVCLDDFHKETVCRQLYCEHIYHDTCIEAWLGTKDTCPNCKKEMNKNAIEEYLANPNKENSGNNQQPAVEGQTPAESEQQKQVDIEQGSETKPLNNNEPNGVDSLSQNKPIELGIAAQLEELIRQEEEVAKEEEKRSKSLSLAMTNGERTPKKLDTSVVRISPSPSTSNLK